jgi:hypothetical protein
VRLLRTILTDELKYVNVREARPKLEADQQVWRSVEEGIRQATVIVIDPKPFAQAIELSLRADQAEPGIDYTEGGVLDTCATAIVARTPSLTSRRV